MTASTPNGKYSQLPKAPALDETVTSVEVDRSAEPDDVRNVDQHEALRDD
ncbi:hypothetical protein [Nocardioides daphniae]|uniref:Uncharacterized protein n=1 Tax=Nocardioides daphniae TaxID=402297 RepID=A0ABQ1Q5R9_9ACTN|nr:hypothetical protein [Nocardioides daphniae]GGD13126.1 hypothetical protein GCM10007231_10180 [Nocardioides daphniae]